MAYAFAEKNGVWVNYNIEAVRAGMTPYFSKYGFSRRFHKEFLAAEEEAKKNGCTNAYLNSFSFQGVEFYKKIGYRVFGEMENFPLGHSVCSLTKKLV